MGKVVPIGCITTLDMPPDQILERAMDQLEGVVILGYDKNGEEFFASSYADGGTVMWLLERCKIKLMQAVEKE